MRGQEKRDSENEAKKRDANRRVGKTESRGQTPGKEAGKW